MNSKDLFHQLVNALTLDVRLAEKEAMISWVLKHRLALSSTEIHKGKTVQAQVSDFSDTIDRLNKEEPLQYILGIAEFYGRAFEVNGSVLIPRPETEILIESALKLIDHGTARSFLDIGTGSGCIGITLSLELPQAKVIATDISAEALTLAAINADRLGAQVQFLQHNILAEALPFNELDVVVSNPPYIREQEKGMMSRNVINNEPAHALFVPDANPLIFHRPIAIQSMRTLRPGGLMILEINEHLGDACVLLLRDVGYSRVSLIQDLDKKDRFVIGFSPA